MVGPNRKLVTVITEAILESDLARDMHAVGVHGYTVVDARGAGRHGSRSGDWSATSNIRIEVLCDEAAAERLAALLQERYFPNYAVVVHISDVTVLRPEKF